MGPFSATREWNGDSYMGMFFSVVTSIMGVIFRAGVTEGASWRGGLGGGGISGPKH